MSESVFPDARPFPVNLRLAQKPVLVVGGGSVAHRKIGQLLDAGAAVTVVAPWVDDRVRSLPIAIETRPYQGGEVAGYSLVITCTDDPAVNAQVHTDGQHAGVWVNSADDPENCEFTLMSVVRSGDLQIGISTEGRSPALSMWLRTRFEREFGEPWAELLDVLSGMRDEARVDRGTSEIDGWMEALDAGVPELVASGNHEAARQLLREHLGLESKTLAVVGSGVHDGATPPGSSDR